MRLMMSMRKWMTMRKKMWMPTWMSMARLLPFERLTQLCVLPCCLQDNLALFPKVPVLVVW